MSWPLEDGIEKFGGSNRNAAIALGGSRRLDAEVRDAVLGGDGCVSAQRSLVWCESGVVCHEWSAPEAGVDATLLLSLALDLVFGFVLFHSWLKLQIVVSSVRFLGPRSVKQQIKK